MKAIKIIGLILMMAVSSSLYAQKKDVVVIKTSAECDMCKKTIEKNLAFEKGVKNADMNLEKKEVTVTYNPKKTSPEVIRKAISNMGYDADSIPANNKAYQKLDECCKKDGNHKH